MVGSGERRPGLRLEPDTGILRDPLSTTRQPSSPETITMLNNDMSINPLRPVIVHGKLQKRGRIKFLSPSATFWSTSTQLSRHIFILHFIAFVLLTPATSKRDLESRPSPTVCRPHLFLPRERAHVIEALARRSSFWSFVTLGLCFWNSHEAVVGALFTSHLIVDRPIPYTGRPGAA